MSYLGPDLTPSLRATSLVERVGGAEADLVYELHSELDIARARFGLTRALSQFPISDCAQARVYTVMTELSWNAVKYAGRGVLCVWLRVEPELRLHPRLEVRLIIADEGPGIDDIDWALSDQKSSGGTLGLGLPGSARLSDEFTLCSPLPNLSYGTQAEAKMKFYL